MWTEGVAARTLWGSAGGIRGEAREQIDKVLLKQSHGITRLAPTVGFAICALISFALLTYALRHLEVGLPRSLGAAARGGSPARRRPDAAPRLGRPAPAPARRSATASTAHHT